MAGSVLFVLSKLLWPFARPSTLLLLLLCLGLLPGPWRRWRAWPCQRMAPLVGLTLLAATLLPFGDWLIQPLETRFPAPPSEPARLDGIIVLGGAIDLDLSEAHGLPALNGNAGRMTEFVALARRHPQARLVFTGGSGSLFPGALREADVARQLFDQLGFDAARVIYENESRNTWENAVLLRRLLQPRPDETWVVITSAFHMPRTVGIFQALGWPVIPRPVAFQTDGRSLLPSLDFNMPARLGRLDAAVHEWCGLLAYRLMGRTTRFFPAPG